MSNHCGTGKADGGSFEGCDERILRGSVGGGNLPLRKLQPTPLFVDGQMARAVPLADVPRAHREREPENCRRPEGELQRVSVRGPRAVLRFL